MSLLATYAASKMGGDLDIITGNPTVIAVPRDPLTATAEPFCGASRERALLQHVAEVAVDLLRDNNTLQEISSAAVEQVPAARLMSTASADQASPTTLPDVRGPAECKTGQHGTILPAEFSRSSALQAEFLTFEIYEAFKQAESMGRVHGHRGNVTTGQLEQS